MGTKKFIDSFNKYLVSACSLSGSLLYAGNKAVSKLEVVLAVALPVQGVLINTQVRTLLFREAVMRG